MYGDGFETFCKVQTDQNLSHLTKQLYGTATSSITDNRYDIFHSMRFLEIKKVAAEDIDSKKSIFKRESNAKQVEHLSGLSLFHEKYVAS